MPICEAADLMAFFRTRAMNALVRGGIATMEELCIIPDEKLRRVRNLGDKCFELSHAMRDMYLVSK